MEYRRFFAELLPRLDAARQLEREFDRRFAHRFNVLDYLRQDELGLSRIVADLLDPTARHGQGTLFLAAFLGLDGVRDALRWPDLDRCRIMVITERQIDHERRIDVSVEIVDAEGNACCLAIENKPYAADQPKQVEDYLSSLESRYGAWFPADLSLAPRRGPLGGECPQRIAPEMEEPLCDHGLFRGCCETGGRIRGNAVFSRALRLVP